jgi:hypothetical protein
MRNSSAFAFRRILTFECRLWPVEQRIGGVDLVADRGLWIGLLRQRFGAIEIVRLPWREPHVDRIAESIDQDEDFAGQCPARPADRALAALFVLPHGLRGPAETVPIVVA